MMIFRNVAEPWNLNLAYYFPSVLCLPGCRRKKIYLDVHVPVP
jgi:hypothetical protein